MKLFKLFLILFTLTLTACGGSSSSDDDPEEQNVSLPDGVKMVLIDTSSPMHYLYDTETNALTDLNDTARSSVDSAIKNLELNDGTNLGQFFIWNDVFEKPDETVQDNGQKIILLKSGMTSEEAISHENLQYLAHYHGDDFSAHSASEFEPTPENWNGSNKQKALVRLNGEFTEHKELFDEVSEAVEAMGGDDAGQTLCRVAIAGHHDEHEEGEGHSESEEEEAAMHFALTESGRMYFFQEENEALSSTQAFVALEGVSSISDCHKVAVSVISEESILVFVADTQMLYHVDSHDGGNFHQHSKTLISDFMPSGFNADLVAIFGEGEEHNHDH